MHLGRFDHALLVVQPSACVPKACSSSQKQQAVPVCALACSDQWKEFLQPYKLIIIQDGDPTKPPPSVPAG